MFACMSYITRQLCLGIVGLVVHSLRPKLWLLQDLYNLCFCESPLDRGNRIGPETNRLDLWFKSSPKHDRKVMAPANLFLLLKSAIIKQVNYWSWLNAKPPFSRYFLQFFCKLFFRLLCICEQIFLWLGRRKCFEANFQNLNLYFCQRFNSSKKFLSVKRR
jgi:hypothetical protein